MPIEIREEAIGHLAQHLRISIAFTVDRAFEITDAFDLREHAVAEPYVKDYDAIPGNVLKIEASHWGLLGAWRNGQHVGGALIGPRSLGLEMLEGRDAVAILWDLRVSPEHRGHGAGSALFTAAERWALANGCTQLEVETQQINLPACRLYAKHGCELTAVNRAAYPELPNEIQLIWSKNLLAST